MKFLKDTKLQNLVLLYTLPALGIITAVFTIVNYNALYGVILNGFDRKLYAVSTTSAAFIDGDEHSQIKSEEDGLYQKYVAPMKEILETAGLTYHYSLVPLDGNKIQYVLDATEGEDHSPAGSTEENPEEEALRLKNVMLSGVPSLSDIQEFDIWGKLKIGSAPILGKDGKAKGLIGADVNISLINAKINQATLKLLGIGVLAFLLSIWASIIISRKFIEPLEEIKQAALLVAAGQFGERAEVSQPRELHDLASAFNQMSSALLERKEKENLDITTRESLFDHQALKESMQLNLHRNSNAGSNGDKSIINLNSKYELLLMTPEVSSGSKAISSKHQVVWVLDKNLDELTSLKLQQDLTYIMSRFSAKGFSKEQIKNKLINLAGGSIVYILLFDFENDTLDLFDASFDQQTYPLLTKLPIRQSENGTLSIQVKKKETYASI